MAAEEVFRYALKARLGVVCELQIRSGRRSSGSGRWSDASAGLPAPNNHAGYAKRYAVTTPAIRQMSMPKPVCPNMATATPPGPPGPRRRRSSTPGCSSWRRNHRPPESVFPRARHGRSLPRCGELAFRTPPRHRAPDREPGTILIPGGGAAGDQGAQNRPACPAMAATRRLRPVPSQRPPGARVSGAHAVL